MAPKRGDIKTQNGQRYRYGYKNGKLMWIKDQSGFNPRIGEKLKIAGKNIKKFGGNVKKKVFGTPDKKQNFSGKTGTKTPNEKMKTWRVDENENKKLQQERKTGSDETYSRKLSPQAAKQVNNTKNESKNKKLKAGSARERLRAKNVKRFGKAHVDRLIAKNKEFQAIKKIKDRTERKKQKEAYRQKYGK